MLYVLISNSNITHNNSMRVWIIINVAMRANFFTRFDLMIKLSHLLYIGRDVFKLYKPDLVKNCIYVEANQYGRDGKR